MRIVFFGTPEFAVPSLVSLIDAGHQIVAVVTQPDRPRGRGQHVLPGAVAAAARARDLPLLQPASLKDDALFGTLAALSPDLGVVAAYGKILAQRWLDLPKLGMINVHSSLLPRWRGAAPVHRAILAGDAVTGVTIMRVVLALDAGPVLGARPVTIDHDETSGELERRLSLEGARILVEVVSALARGEAVEVPQDERHVTYAARLEKHEAHVDWRRSAQAIHDQIRGLQPWPRADARFRGARLILRRSKPEPHRGSAADPGTIVALPPDGLDVQTGQGVVRLLEVQAEDRPAVGAPAFCAGHHVRIGEAFDPWPGVP